MRYLLIALLIIVALLVSFPLYYRGRVEGLISQSLIQLDSDPGQAYLTFTPVFAINDGITLGKSSQARRRFIEELTKAAQRKLAIVPPTEAAFGQILQLYPLLIKIEDEHRISTVTERERILRRIREIEGEIRAKGTLSAWEAMIQFMQKADSADPEATGKFADFSPWLAGVMAFDARLLSLREALLNSKICLYQGLQSLGIQTGLAKLAPVVAAPGNLADLQLISAEKSFAEGLDVIETTGLNAPDGKIAPELSVVEAILRYNQAAMNVAHLQDLGEMGPRTVSGYIAEMQIHSDQPRVPPSETMYDEFAAEAKNTIHKARDIFTTTPSMAETERRICQALTLWTESLLLMQEGRDGAPLRLAAETLSADSASTLPEIIPPRGLDGSAAVNQRRSIAMVTTLMRQSSRPLLIQRIPGPSRPDELQHKE